jgi:hypothetical protein
MSRDNDTVPANIGDLNVANKRQIAKAICRMPCHSLTENTFGFHGISYSHKGIAAQFWRQTTKP